MYSKSTITHEERIYTRSNNCHLRMKNVHTNTNLENRKTQSDIVRNLYDRVNSSMTRSVHPY